MKKSICLLFFATLLSGTLFSQTGITSFNATGGAYSTTYLSDYQCLGINPANLGWTRNNQKINLGLLEFSGFVYSEPLKRSQLVNDLLDSDLKLTLEQKIQAARDFTDSRFFGAASLLYAGLSYYDENLGGFAFNIRERLVWYSLYNEKTANFLFLGWRDSYFDEIILNQSGDTIGSLVSNPNNLKYITEICEGSSAHYLHTREFNFGYGRRLFNVDDYLSIYGGINIKYIQGYAAFHYNHFVDGDIIGFSAFSPLYGVKHDTPTPSAVTGSDLKKVGTGFGLDIGTTVQILNKLKVGLAVNDLGKINWNGNAYDGYNVRAYKITTPGIDNYNAFEQVSLISVDAHPDDPEDWQGIKNREISLPTNLRAGASYQISEWIEAGADLYVPFGKKVPGTFSSPVFGLGANFGVTQWLQISAGFVNGGITGSNIPIGVVLKPSIKNATWQIGIATNDISTLLIDDNPTMSASFGFLRFGF